MYAKYLLVRMGRVQENNYFFLYLTKLNTVWNNSSAFGSQVFWQPSFFLIQSTLCVCENFHKSNLGIQRILWSGQIIWENWWICCDSFWRYFMQIHPRVFSVKTGLCLGPKIKSRSPNLKRGRRVCSPRGVGRRGRKKQCSFNWVEYQQCLNRKSDPV